MGKKKKTKRTNLPPDYRPYKLLNVCGNNFENGQIPIASSTSVVLLVGKGDTPSIWLSAPSKDNPDDRGYVVEKNISKSSSISVKPKGNSTVVTFGDTTIAKVVKISDDAAEINDIDLRPLGLKIYKEQDGLRIGNMLIKGNYFKNVNTMIFLGKKPTKAR